MGLRHELPPYRVVRSSARRHPKLAISALGGVVVTIPPSMSESDAKIYVSEHLEWIIHHSQRLGVTWEDASLPTEIDLVALTQRWKLTYENSTPNRALLVRQSAPGVLTFGGPTQDVESVYRNLGHWLKVHAHGPLWDMTQVIAREMAVHPTSLTIRLQRTRWGSITSAGALSLNASLCFLSNELVRHVIIHELAHLTYMSHNSQFWALVARYDPNAKLHRNELRTAGNALPAWLRFANAPRER